MSKRPIPRVLADDLSGACECAGLAVLHGLQAEVCLRPSGETRGEARRVRVWDLDCRERGDEEAARTVSEALARPPDAHAPRPVYLKIDSAFRGPIGAMARAAADSLAQDRVLICCAVPYTERWTTGGVHTVGGVPLDGTPFANDSRGPIRSAHLPTLLGGQLGETAASLRPEDIAARWPAGVRWAVADARSVSDLRAIARAWSGRPLAVGAGGLWQAILNETAGPPSRRAVRSERSSPRRTLIVNGSANPVAREQIAHVRTTRPDVACVTAPTERIPPDEAMRRIVGETMAILERTEFDELILSGGRTARSVLDALDVGYLEIAGQRPGGLTEAWAVLPGGRRLSVAIKPGSYGPRDAYERIVEERLNRPSAL